jgi:hypothetical protein
VKPDDDPLSEEVRPVRSKEESAMKKTGLLTAALGLFLFAQTAYAGWTAAKRLTWTPGYSTLPDVAADSSGNFHMVWHDDTPGNYEIYYIKRK